VVTDAYRARAGGVLGRALRVAPRGGGVRLGCLLALVVVGAVLYYGGVIGDKYLRYYRYQDAFKQEVRFAAHHSDEEIKIHLRAVADSLQLPDDAQHLFLRRKPHHILIWNEYYDHVELPFMSRDFYFNPHAEGEL
jgi:hypothetical protein